MPRAVSVLLLLIALLQNGCPTTRASQEEGGNVTICHYSSSSLVMMMISLMKNHKTAVPSGRRTIRTRRFVHLRPGSSYRWSCCSRATIHHQEEKSRGWCLDGIDIIVCYYDIPRVQSSYNKTIYLFGARTRLPKSNTRWRLLEPWHLATLMSYGVQTGVWRVSRTSDICDRRMWVETSIDGSEASHCCLRI